MGWKRLQQPGDHDRLATLNEVRAKIAIGLEQARADQLLDGEAAIEQLEEHLATRTASARRPNRLSASD